MSAIKLSDFLATYGAVSIYIVAPGQSNIVQYDLADFEGEEWATAYELLTAQLTPQALAAVGETTTDGVEAGQIEWRAAPDQYLGVNHKLVVINRLVVWGTLPTTDETPATEATPEVITNDDDADTFEPIGRATYSVEDNKLRLYPDARLDAPTYERVKAAGFKWAPKQELFVAPMWTPQREDLLLELCGEVEDEDYSATERAADRAERFEGYREKRTAEAVGHADTFDAGPRAFGHQSAARANRQARRHDRHRRNACSQWSKAEYWQARTEGVIANALHRADPRVRRSRIKKLEAELRGVVKDRKEYAAKFKAWVKVPTLEGADQPLEMETYQPWANDPQITSTRPKLSTPAAKFVYVLTNSGNCYGEYTHPRKERPVAVLYTLLTLEEDPITPAEASALWLNGRDEPYPADCVSNRWMAHYENRLTYERAMLANEGGTAAEVEMIVGGWINTGNRTGSVFTNVATGWKQIHAITRSPATKKITSVKVMGMVGCRDPKPGLVSVNIERLGEGNYRAPTAEELETFNAKKDEAKAEAKAAKKTAPKAPPTINPTDEDAQRLQQQWNDAAFSRVYSRDGHDGNHKDTPVLRMTQAQYSDRSKGSYGLCKIIEVSERGKEKFCPRASMNAGDRVTVFKIRIGLTASGAPAVIVLTDKPQKPIPWDEIAAAEAAQVTVEKLRFRMGEIAAAIGANWYDQLPKETQQLLQDASYAGLVDLQSLSQMRFTEIGLVHYRTWKDMQDYSPKKMTPAVVEAEEPAPAIVDGEALLFA